MQFLINTTEIIILTYFRNFYDKVNNNKKNNRRHKRTYIHVHLQVHTHTHLTFNYALTCTLVHNVFNTNICMCWRQVTYLLMFVCINISSVLSVCIACRWRVLVDIWTYLLTQSQSIPYHPIPLCFSPFLYLFYWYIRNARLTYIMLLLTELKVHARKYLF